MSVTIRSLFESPRCLLWFICLGALALVALTALRAAPQIAQLLLQADGDDQMRLMEVRDLLSGQSWWDTRQYRVLPPEGIPMHWSRYIDAGIAGIILAASTLVPTSSAELVAVILWPSFLACLMVLVLAHGTARLLGPVSAIGALAVFLSWSKLGGEFVPPRIDHHNVQILCGTALFYLSLVPGRAWVLGALGGIVTAFSLAIGLEQLPYFATIWGLMALRHAFGQANTGPWLLGFGAAITLSAPLFMAGQTPTSAWGTPWCDVLATPVMALGLVGVVATLTPVLADRVLTGPLTRIAALLVVTALGIWLAFPLLGQCLAGPYSAVSPEMRSIIENNIVEAQSASILLSRDPSLLGRVLLPPLVVAGLALLALWPLRGRVSPPQATALVQAFVVVGVGFGFALVQVRAANLMTPAVPFLGGFVVHAFSQVPQSSRLRMPLLALLLLGMPATVTLGVRYFLEPAPAATLASGSTDQGQPKNSCRNAAAMAEVASLPRSVLFNPVNLGPAILLSTSQSVTSAAYHRSPDAFWNGIGAFQSEAALHAALAKSGADFLVFCMGGLADGEAMLLHSLKASQLPIWLKPEPGDRKLIAVYKVDKLALAATNGAP